ncbi:MAG: hypothetical protein WA418_21440 [Bradyrhizobium sp.]
MSEYGEYTELAAALHADIHQRLEHQVLTAASLREAAVGAIQALLPPAPVEFKIERDPEDPSRFNLWLPLDLAKRMGLLT